MFKQILIYSTSTGLQRAIAFLASLVLARTYDVSVIGEYILVQTVGQLLVPLLTLNVTVALSRESKQHPNGSIILLRNVCFFSTLAFIGGLIIGLRWQSNYWIAFGVALGASESISTGVISFLLGREASNRILVLSMGKTVCFATLVLLAYMHLVSIFVMVLLWASINYSLATVSAYWLFREVRRVGAKHAETVTTRVMLRYSLATLPHTAALWASVSADRLLLGIVQGKASVGVYTMSYTIAQTVMIVVSGVISALPPRVANDPVHWRMPENIDRFMKNLSTVCAGVTVVNLIAIYLNNNYLHLIPNTNRDSYLLVGGISAGFYFSIYYVFFASYLYLNRCTTALTYSGFALGPLNFGMFYLLIYVWGQRGAALGLLFSYINFGLAYGFAAAKHEPALRQAARQIGRTAVYFLLFAFLTSILFWWRDA